MSPHTIIASTVIALGWLLWRVQTRETRRQVRIKLKIIRRYTLYDYDRSDEADDMVSALDELAQGVRGKHGLHVWSLSDGAIARRQCAAMQEYRCVISGRFLGIHGQIHHIVPLGLGGTWEQTNLCYIDPRFHRPIHDERLMKEDWMTESEWEQVVEFRAVIVEAGERWRMRFSKQYHKKGVTKAVAA